MNHKKQFEQLIIEKAMKDEFFRDQLKSDPRGTIERELGITIPASMNLNILEEMPDKVYLVLPHSGGSDNAAELTEAELESVAGGYNIWSQGTDCDTCVVGCGAP